MILSQNNIEDIADIITGDFNQFCGVKEDLKRVLPRKAPIDRFAKDYLNLEISYAKLSSDGSLCGITAYEDTEFIFRTEGVQHVLQLRRNQVVLDESYIRPGREEIQDGSRRFTLAHECAHQILYQMETNAGGMACRKRYSRCRCTDLRDLGAVRNWTEWQANALGAALLMPRHEMDLAMDFFARGRKLSVFGGKITNADRYCISMMKRMFGVSRTALVIRLRHLDLLEDRPWYEYREPAEALL